MVWIGRCMAEQQPHREDEERGGEQRRPVFVGVEPRLYRLERGTFAEDKLLDSLGLRQNEMFYQGDYQCHDDQHLDRRKTNLAATADIVADEIAGPPRQLQQRIG